MTNDPQSPTPSLPPLLHVSIPPPVLEDLRRITRQSNPRCLPIASGLSPAHVWQVEADSQCWALKCHPGRNPSSLESIHRWQLAMHQPLGALVPRLHFWPSTLSTCLQHHDSTWELMDWANGLPIPQLGLIEQPSLIHLAQRLAQLHCHSFSFLSQFEVPNGWIERSQRWNAQAPLAIPQLQALSRSQSACPSLDFTPLQTALSHLFEQATSWLVHAKTPRKVTWILRDVWRPHLLFHQKQLSALIDWTAARIDWPLFDLVRALNSLLPWDDLTGWELAWNTYQQSRRLGHHPLAPDEDFPLLRSAAFLSLTLSTLFWVSHLSQPQRSPYPAASLRLQELLFQLSLATR